MVISGCSHPYLVEDGYCNDITNNPECNYDGGDCCHELADFSYCLHCECLTPPAAKMAAIMPKNLAASYFSTFGNQDPGYQPSSNLIMPKIAKAPPKRLQKTSAANSKLGLTLLLYPDEENYHSSADNNFIGFKVHVHSPYDYAEVSGKGLAIGKATEAFVAVGAQHTATENMAKITLKKQKCLSHAEDLTQHPEVILEAFQNYSQKACLLECHAREIMKVCGCLPYNFPTWKISTSCDLDGLKCLSNLNS